MKTHRLARISEVIREVASETILFEIRDPRVQGVTVTRAEVSGDLQHAKVYVSVMGTEAQEKLTMHGLKHAAGFVQKKLADRLQTRFTPIVTFVLDAGVKKSIEVARLINEAKAEAGPEQDAAPAEGGEVRAESEGPDDTTGPAGGDGHPAGDTQPPDRR